MELLIDKRTNLLNSYTFISANEVDGDIEMNYSFSDYSLVRGILFPGRRVVKNNLKILRDEQMKVCLDDPIDPAVFQIPLGYGKSLPRLSTIKEVAKNIFLIELANGYQVMCLNFSDHLMVLEAVAGSEEVIKKIKEHFPGKQIKFVAISHYHEDHSRGIKAYADSNVTVLASQQNMSYLNYLIGNKSLLLGAGHGAGQAPKLRAVVSRTTFSDSVLKMEMIEFGPNSHADRLFAYYFPDENILFQADLLIATDQGKLASPIIPVNMEFFYRLKQLGIKPDMIYGVHSKPVSYLDFAQAVAQHEKAGN
jgi:glyoxylase-like metal-dependent hydrolase (beta-lactamase superfamily II)